MTGAGIGQLGICIQHYGRELVAAKLEHVKCRVFVPVSEAESEPV